MAKLSRESRLRERRIEKEARKQARRLSSALPPEQSADAERDVEVGLGVEHTR